MTCEEKEWVGLEYRFYKPLCQDARHIRTEVFVKEQGFQREFDHIDQIAECLVLYRDSKAVATGRLYPSERCGEYGIGRIAVLPDYRGQRLGAEVLSLLEERARQNGAGRLLLSAQCRAQGFYERHGFHTVGAVYLDESCPHIKMEKELLDPDRAVAD